MDRRARAGWGLVAGVVAALGGCVGVDKPPPASPIGGPVSARPLTGQGTTPQELAAPEAGRVCLVMAEGLEREGKDADAIAYYERARESAPELADRAQRRLAVLYDRVDNPTRATAEFVDLLRRYPKDADLLNDAGYSYYNRGNLADAEAVLRRAVAADKGHKRAWVNLGLVLAQQGRVDDGFAAFTRAVGPADAHANLGFVLMAAGKHDEARGRYAQALALEPAHPAGRAGLARLDGAVARKAEAASGDGGTAPAPGS